MIGMVFNNMFHLHIPLSSVYWIEWKATRNSSNEKYLRFTLIMYGLCLSLLFCFIFPCSLFLSIFLSYSLHLSINLQRQVSNSYSSLPWFYFNIANSLSRSFHAIVLIGIGSTWWEPSFTVNEMENLWPISFKRISN